MNSNMYKIFEKAVSSMQFAMPRSNNPWDKYTGNTFIGMYAFSSNIVGEGKNPEIRV